ncbi:MAG: hypothetical protein LBJ41_07255 [Treponema sp.]|jgi:hypothetical protein|nr:hypothetical protein [Treponema sp.]
MLNKRANTPALILLCVLQAAAVQAQTAPLWVTNQAAAFPDRDWLSVVEAGRDRASAQNAALNALARVFKTNVQSMTRAYEEFAQAVSESDNKKIATFTESQDFAQEVKTSSNVTGLVGVQTDVWTAADGMVYANARMNRRDCAARYTAMIHENERVIRLLKEIAAENPATFEAFESLSFAANVAAVTDNFQSLLEVLDVSAIGRQREYGNADTVKALAQAEARSITITIQVEGDVSNRMSRAFSSFFTKRDFRAATSGNNAYTLYAILELEEADVGNQRIKYVRYLLMATLEDQNGKEVFSFSVNDRQGQASESAARQRALQAAEAAITSGSFATTFDAYLASLLE